LYVVCILHQGEGRKKEKNERQRMMHTNAPSLSTFLFVYRFHLVTRRVKSRFSF
jgi:hypothetical protein